MIIDGTAKLAARRAAMTISRTDLLVGLMDVGWITAAEAEAWSESNTLPAAVLAAVDGLPEADRPAARIRLRGFTTCARTDPLVAALAASEGRTDAEIDAFFTTYSKV